MKHLIVIADLPGGSNAGLKRALALQKLTGAAITLLGFCYANIDNLDELPAAHRSRSKLEKAILEKRHQQLTTLLKSLRATRRKITTKVQWSKDIHQAINAYCRKHPADMLIKSGNRKGSWLHTSTDWHLLRECPIPVMITATKGWKKQPRIVAAVDFDTDVRSKRALNDKIVRQGQQLATSLGCELHLAFANCVPRVLADMDLIDPKKYAADKRRALAPRIRSFCQKHGLDPKHTHIRRGPADKIIPSIANALKADLVLTGTVGRRGIRGKLLGNTAEGILKRLYTDILAIKP